MRFFLGFILLISGPLATGSPILASGTAGEQNWELEEVARPGGVIWGMTFLDEHRLAFTRRGGTAGLIDVADGRVTELENLPNVRASGQGGLLDIAFPTRQNPQQWIYFTYSKPVTTGAATTLARAKLESLQFTSWQELLETDSASNTAHHFGSRITFDGQGHLFFGVGDRGFRSNAQNLENHAGSVLRLNLDGSVPTDNPFSSDTSARKEIWSYGHRNPQGLFYDQSKKQLWEIEHGPRGGDEINLVEGGKNYGWPVLSYGKEYRSDAAVGEATKRDGMEQPIKTYIPSIAPGSLIVYSGKAFPAWQGDLFSGALKLQHLNRVSLDKDGGEKAEQRLLGNLGERIRDIEEAPDGLIYLSTDSGRILRIKPLAR